MTAVHVAVVCRDPDTRLAAAAAFDGAPASWRVELCAEAPPRAQVIVLGPDATGEGIRFDPQRPEALVPAVEEALGRTGARVIAVTSPSGGTGTTSVALHLAQSLAARRDTCLLELHRRAGLRARLGLEESARTWASLEDSPSSLMRSALPVPAGFRVLLAPDDPRTQPPGDLLERAAGAFEVLLVEAFPPATLEAALTVADAAVLVMAPTVVGAERSRRLLGAHPETSWAVVTNRLGPGGETTRAALEHILGRPLALELPCAPALRDAEDEGRLLSSPLYRWRRSIDRLARALEGSSR
jgi:hypothetical protein